MRDPAPQAWYPCVVNVSVSKALRSLLGAISNYMTPTSFFTLVSQPPQSS